MKELDFDELDRAVNSLMPSVTNTDTPVDDSIKTLTIPSSTPSTDTPIPTRPASPVPSRPTASSTPPAARRGGRFMDVVHPSSDMKPETGRPAAVSRQGVTIAPSTSTTVPEEPIGVPEAQPPKVVEQAPLPAAEPTHMASEWPDPLDVAGFKHEPEVKPKVETEQPKPDNVSKDEEVAPLTSPFLPDTKVEKRPLGGPVIVGDSIEPMGSPGLGKQDLSVDDPSDQLPAAPDKVAVQMPEELQENLVAIESGAASKELPTDISSADTKPEPAEEPAPAPTPAPQQKEENSPPVGPVSIPQQYREEPNTGEAENGSIYDTDTYHQPLAHPGKKKSGWLWVVWIILILLVGAGAGAALYFLGVV